MIKEFDKARHGLTHKSVDCKDKQNYTNISLLLHQNVEECLKELQPSMKTMGTVFYLKMMRDVRDTFFDKSLPPALRLYLIWKATFMLRIWRTWLAQNNFSEDLHFVTQNAYTCVEINAHMLLNLIHNVQIGIFPKEALRIWLTGSQACEEMFRLLRSMTPVFSTIVNFTLKGVLEKINKLQYISAAECDSEIFFHGGGGGSRLNFG